MPSRENLAIAQYLRDAGVPFVISATTNGKHAPASWHKKYGTGGQGLATDFAWYGDKRYAPQLKAIFDAFKPVEHQLAELIYTDAPYSIDNGRRMGPQGGHTTHVHVAVPKGVFITWPGSPSRPTTSPTLEDDMPKLPTDIVDALPFPDLTGAWLLQRDGGVITKGDPNRFYGSPHATPQAERPKPWPEFVSIKPWGTGYVVTAVTGWFGNYDAAVRDDLKRRGLLK